MPRVTGDTRHRRGVADSAARHKGNRAAGLSATDVNGNSTIYDDLVLGLCIESPTPPQLLEQAEINLIVGTPTRRAWPGLRAYSAHDRFEYQRSDGVVLRYDYNGERYELEA